MNQHHNQVEANTPELRSVMLAGFEEIVQFDTLVAAFRGSPFVVHQTPVITTPWWRSVKSDIGLHGNRTSSAERDIGTRRSAGTGTVGIERATEFGILALQIIAIGFHLETGFTDRDAVRTDSYAMIIGSLLGIAKVEIDIRANMFALAQGVHSHRVVSGIQQKRSRFQFRSQSPETEESFTETVRIMFGNLIEQRKEWKFRIRVYEQIEIVTEVPAFTGRIPTDRAVGLREVAITVTIEVAAFPTITGMMGTKTGSSDDRCTIASDVKFTGIELSTAYGLIQEAGTEDAKQHAISFLIDGKGGVRKTGNKFCDRFLINGSRLLPLTFGFLDLFTYRLFVMGRDVGCSIIPEPADKVVESANTRYIPGLKSTENSEELRCVKGFNPVSNGDNIHCKHEQKGTQHTGRWTRQRTVVGILILHDAIHS